MTDPRIHSASRVIIAPARTIFRAFLNPEAVASWRTPKGMTAQILAFDPRVGGSYRMELRYGDGGAGRAKSTINSDIVCARFVELLPDEMVVEAVDFQSGDPAYTGTMTVTTTLVTVADGTKVTFTAVNVPPGISDDDHLTGMESTLKNLANFIE